MFYDVTEFYGNQSARAGFTSDDGDPRADATDTKLIPYIGDIRLSPFFIFGFFVV